jgi:carbon storage regulator
MESQTMLVLSRKLNESIVIGDRIRITVVGLRGNQVRLGIEAPGDTSILREELLSLALEDETDPIPDSAIAGKSPRHATLAGRRR